MQGGTGALFDLKGKARTRQLRGIEAPQSPRRRGIGDEPVSAKEADAKWNAMQRKLHRANTVAAERLNEIVQLKQHLERSEPGCSTTRSRKSAVIPREQQPHIVASCGE